MNSSGNELGSLLRISSSESRGIIGFLNHSFYFNKNIITKKNYLEEKIQKDFCPSINSDKLFKYQPSKTYVLGSYYFTNYLPKLFWDSRTNVILKSSKVLSLAEAAKKKNSSSFCKVI